MDYQVLDHEATLEDINNYHYDEAISSDKVTKSCKFLIKSVKENK